MPLSSSDFFLIRVLPNASVACISPFRYIVLHRAERNQDAQPEEKCEDADGAWTREQQRPLSEVGVEFSYTVRRVRGHVVVSYRR